MLSVALLKAEKVENPELSSINYSDYCKIIGFVDSEGLQSSNGSKCTIVNGYNIKVYPWEGIIITSSFDVSIVDNGFDGIDPDDDIDKIEGIDNLKDFLNSFPWKDKYVIEAQNDNVDKVEVDIIEVLEEVLNK